MCGDSDIPGPVEGKDVDGSGVFLFRVSVDARLPPQCEDSNGFRVAVLLRRDRLHLYGVVQRTLWIAR